MVNQGYKQTEIGIIPANWEICVAKDLYLKARIGWQGLKKDEYLDEGDYYLVTGTDFSDNKISWENCHYVLQERYDQDKNIQLSIGDILITKDGSIGKTAFVDTLDKPATLNSGIFLVRPKNDKIDQAYLYFVFKSEYFNKFLKDLTAGSTIVHLYQKDFVAFKYPLPERKEQERIAEALSDVDNMISSLEKLIAKKKAVKQGAMQELLTGKKRLPGFTGEWKEKQIGEYGDFVSGNGFPLKYQGNPSGIYPFYKVSDFNNIGNSREMNKANNYISDDVANTLSCSIIPKQSIVFAKIGAAIALERKRITSCACCIDNNMMSFQPYEKEIAQFMCYLFQTIRFGELVEATALPSLSGKTIGEIKKLFPPTAEEQTAIASILSDMDNEIEALEQKLAKTRQLKQGMMQQLLTGKIRLV